MGYACAAASFGTPLYVQERRAADLDQASNGWVWARGSQGASLGMFAQTKHVFRFWDGTLQLTLPRCSYSPDPDPELGQHQFCFAVIVWNEGTSAAEAAAA